MLVLEWKERAFIEKVDSECFCWFPAAILVHQNRAPIWLLHAKLYKIAWNVSANNSETVGHKDVRLGQIVYILVFYNISFSWLLPLDSFQFIFLLRDSENDLYTSFRITLAKFVKLELSCEEPHPYSKRQRKVVAMKRRKGNLKMRFDVCSVDLFIKPSWNLLTWFDVAVVV